MKLQQNTRLALYSLLEFAADPERQISAAEIAHKAWHDNTSLLDACLALGYLSEKEFKELARPETMLGPKA